MDCYGQIPSIENRFGIPHYNRIPSETSLVNSSSNRASNPAYMVKSNNENSIFSLSHQRNNSPIRFSQHQYSLQQHRMPSSLSLHPTLPTPLNYYHSNFDPSLSRNYLPRAINNFPPSVDPYRESLQKINSASGEIDEYYRNNYSNYQQSFNNNYEKLNVPKNSYFNHHLGLSPYRTSHLEAPPRSFYPMPKNEYYDPIAGLHQTVRNGFKDNIALSNTYHSIHNFSPPLTTSHLKKPHCTNPYNHHLFPSSYSNFLPYDAKLSSFDYYRGNHSFLNSRTDYQNSNAAQYHLYQQHHLMSKHHNYLPQSYYHNHYSSPMPNDNLSNELERINNNSPKVSELDKNKISSSPEQNKDKLDSLIKEELFPVSSSFELRTNESNKEEQNFSSPDSLEEDVSLEINKNCCDKIEPRAESSVSETNTVTDVNSETTVASSPLTSVSSYTDSGISGCSNIIDGSNASDGSSVEDKCDENNINQNNSINIEEDSIGEKHVEVNAKINDNLNLDELAKEKNEKENDNSLNTKVKKSVKPSNTHACETRTIPEKDNQLDHTNKLLSEQHLSNKNHQERINKDPNIQMPNKQQNHSSRYNSNSVNSNINLSRTGNVLQSQYQKFHQPNWSTSYHYQYQSRSKSQLSLPDNNSPIINNNNNSNYKYSNKRSVKMNSSTNNNNISKNRVLECDFIPSKKSRKKLNFDNFSSDSIELREEIKDIKPLPDFQQAFGSTEIGRFLEIFQNNSPSEYSHNSNTPYDYYSIENNSSPYHCWDTVDSLEGPLYSNTYKSSMCSNYSENFHKSESSKENYFQNSFANN